MDFSETKHLPKVDHTPAELGEERRLLLKAADLMEARGHCKGRLATERFHGAVCLYGALYAAANHGDAWASGPHIAKAGEAALLVRHALGLKNSYSEIDWNNAPERTKDEVVAKLRAVALGL
jgi:hypothetical protein